jgi:hypothetical protein
MIITSSLFIGFEYMSSKWKLRKLATSLVLWVFWDDNVSVVQKAVFPRGSSLSAQTYGSSTDVQKFITLRLFIVSRCTNNRWKQERVFYNYYIGLLVRFQTCQRWNLIFYLLLTVKLDLTSMSEMFIFKFSWWIHGWTPIVVLQHRDGVFILFSLVSTRALYFWLLNCVGITMKAPWTPLNHMVTLPPLSPIRMAPDRVTHSHWFR